MRDEGRETRDEREKSEIGSQRSEAKETEFEKIRS
jgi:hypothetical protein